MRSEQVGPGLEVVEATGLHVPFQPHKHECYVVGLTTSGVQAFDYRGERRNALPGEAFAIHPDETHDGRPGTDSGYGYRAAYIEPEIISKALGGRPIPFVKEPVSTNPVLVNALNALFRLPPDRTDDIAVAGCTVSLADAFVAMSDSRFRQATPADAGLARSILHCLRDHAVSGISMAELERSYGMDRFTITRLFRRQFGLSPRAYLVQRRVAVARHLIGRGVKLADAAYAAGFADQSHMTRQFVKAFGMTPSRWKALTM